MLFRRRNFFGSNKLSNFIFIYYRIACGARVDGNGSVMQRPSEAFVSALSSNIEKTINFERQPISGDFYFIELMRG